MLKKPKWIRLELSNTTSLSGHRFCFLLFLVIAFASAISPSTWLLGVLAQVPVVRGVFHCLDMKMVFVSVVLLGL
ncbi:hypothetical protein VNO78_23392 [Psophocarpus tetragonolobus]|uniref:Uncharacterized protein n=1 Tax=Psophocarpus tetragonolobus TaxID=3891 RepID=A0AAN9S4T2_PSOTE